MLKQIVLLTSLALGLTACNTKNATEKVTEKSAKPTPVASSGDNTSGALANSATAISTTSTTAPSVADGKIHLDWQKIDSGEPAVDKNTFKYSIALDSVPVKNYMAAYHVDAKTAQYNLTVGMAVNEALSKILDQVGTSYVSHELTAGNDSKFIIHTTTKVAPSEHTYIFAEPFAKGLSIPIHIVPDGKK